MGEQTIWLVGEVLQWSGRGRVRLWGVVGVFDSREGALAACRLHQHFVTPLPLNVPLPAADGVAEEFERIEWPCAPAGAVVRP